MSLFDRRIDALEDVLAHPGRHGARMARALYRAEHEGGAQLSVSSDIGLLMDRVNHDIDHHGRASTDDFARLHDWVMNYDSSRRNLRPNSIIKTFACQHC